MENASLGFTLAELKYLDRHYLYCLLFFHNSKHRYFTFSKTFFRSSEKDLDSYLKNGINPVNIFDIDIKWLESVIKDDNIGELKNLSKKVEKLQE